MTSLAVPVPASQSAGGVPPEPLPLAGMVDPVRGTGVLQYYPTAPGARDTLTIRLAAPPWHSTGRQPFVWDLTPAGPPHGIPAVTLALARTVRMEWNPAEWSGIMGRSRPALIIVRVQDEAVLPPPEEPVLAHQLIVQPFPWYAAQEEGDEPPPWWLLRVGSAGPFSNREATVTPLPNGLRVTHDYGDWAFDVRAPLAEPAGFSYEIHFPQPYGYFMRLVHTSNVKIEGWLSRDFRRGVPQVFLETAVVRRLKDVPPQGALLEPSRFRFQHYNRFDLRLSAEARRQVFVLETIIGVIPIIGTLFDVAQLAYAASTGRSIWGERIGQEEVALLGACALLSVGLGVKSLAKSLGRVARERAALRVALDPGVAQAVERQVERRVLDAVEAVPPQEQRKIAEVLEQYADGAVDARAVVRAVSDAVSPRVATLAQEEQALTRVFSEDLHAFRDAELTEGYARYVAKQEKAQQRVLNPLEWAQAQRPKSRYHHILVRELGVDYHELLGRLIRRPVVREVTPRSLAVLEQYGHLIEEYRTLRKYTSGVGNVLEVDHLLERRFRNSPRWDRIAIHDDDLLSIIVARDPGVARQISGYRSYVHTTKTSLLGRLIPHGAEDQFTTQQWWDATVYAFRSLGMDERGLQRLKEQFELFVKESGRRETIIYRFDQVLDDFLPSQGWPSIPRRPR